MASRKKRSQTSKTRKSRQQQVQRLPEEAFDEGRIAMPLVEEELKVTKNWVQAGEVILRKTVEKSIEEVPVQLAYEEVQVDRVDVNRALEDGEVAEPHQDGDVWVIPIVHEQLVVAKRRIVAEEIRVTKRPATREETLREEVRREDFKIETAGDLNYLDSEGSQPNPQ